MSLATRQAMTLLSVINGGLYLMVDSGDGWQKWQRQWARPSIISTKVEA